MSLIGDGIGHTAFAGVAAGYLLGVSPVLTALVASLAGAVGIEWLRSRRPTAGDQALALLFYTGIAAGVVLVSAAGALNVDLFSFLFGSLLTVTPGGVLPVIAASRVAGSLRSTLLLSTALGLASVLGGLTIAYYADMPPGGTIVLLAAASFALAAAVESLR